MTRRSRLLLALVAALAAAAPAPSFDAAPAATRWGPGVAAKLGVASSPQPLAERRSGSHPTDSSGSSGQAAEPQPGAGHRHRQTAGALHLPHGLGVQI